MKLALFNIPFLCCRTLFLNKEDQRQYPNIEIKHDESIEKGKALGQVDDLKINLNNEEDIQKFNKVALLPDVPEGMGEVAKVIEDTITDEIEEMKKGERFFIIYFIDDKTALLPADHPNDMMKVFISSDKNLAKEMNTPFPGVYGFNPRDKTSYQFPLNEEIVKTISHIVNLDLIGMLTYQNLENYKATGLHSYYVFIKPEEIVSFATEFKAKASTVKHQGKFCIIPYKGDQSQLFVFGLTEEDLPGLLFINDGEKYPLKKCTENDVAKFVQDVLDKKLEPVYSSQDEPENNDELEVKVFTRNNLNKYKLDTTKDKLIVFSSPHCNFCVQLRPVIEELGAIAKANFNNKLVIGSCDITINDINDFDISSVPKIYLVKGDTNEVFQYESKERSAKSIAEFIKVKGAFKTDLTSFVKSDDQKPDALKSEVSGEKPSEIAGEAREL